MLGCGFVLVANIIIVVVLVVGIISVNRAIIPVISVKPLFPAASVTMATRNCEEKRNIVRQSGCLIM